MMRWTLVVLSLLLAGCSRPLDPQPGPPQRTAPWDPELVTLMSKVPVQHDGRVKPLATLAAYALYEIHGRRDMKLAWPAADGGAPRREVLTPVEWLLDVWFFPDQAGDYPLFRIENIQVLTALGIEHEGGQRFDFEYISYRRLLRHVDPLMEAAQRARRKQRSQQTPVEEHLVELARQINQYHGLHQHLVALRTPFQLEGDELRGLYGGRGQVGLPELLEQGNAFMGLLRGHVDNPSAAAAQPAMRIARVLTAEAQEDHDPAMFPPLAAVADQPRWATLGRLIDQSLTGRLQPEHQAMLGHLHAALVAGDTAARDAALRQYADAVIAAASARGEQDAASLEAKYHAWNLHYQSLHWFLFGFVLVGVSWMMPRRRWLWWLALLGNAYPLVLLWVDMGLRSAIAGRPMISNLYDTFLFIPATGVLAALVVEAINKRRFALSVAPVMGAVCIMLARLFEVSDGKDTLREIPAVLRSNFWLATHVTTINIGYGAGILAALLGSLWLVLRTFRIGGAQPAWGKSLVRMTYGVTCFGLFFAVVGTILGGVWAEDSWGRFWGWDPKENGALLICLSQVAMLHARMSGMVGDRGICTWSGFTGIVIAFSWFHVNLLEVGLHSYGFSGGLKSGLFTYYYTQGGLLLIGAVGWLMEKFQPAPAPQAAGAATGSEGGAQTG